MKLIASPFLSKVGFTNLLFPLNNFQEEVCEGEKEPIGFSPIESTCLTKGRNELRI